MFNYFGIIFVLQLMYALCQCVWRIIRQNRTRYLENNFTVVINIVHIMNTDAAFLFFIGDHRFMHRWSVHALSAIFWQKGRMDIDDLSGICFKQDIGELPEKTGQDNKINLSLFQLIHITIAPEKFFLFNNDRGNLV